MFATDKTRRTLVAFAALAAVGLGLAHTDTARAAGAQILSVLVTNDATHPIPVQVTQAPQAPRVSTDDNLEPVMLTITDETIFGDNGPFVVPAGKRLVIEAVYWRIYSWLPVYQASLFPGASFVRVPLAIQSSIPDVNPSAGSVYATIVGGPVRLYVESGQRPYLSFNLVSLDGRPSAGTGVIVGHYVSAP